MIERRAFVVGASAVALSAGCPTVVAAETGPTNIRAVLKTLIGDVTPVEGKIVLDLTEVAENGNTIPYTVTVESPMSPGQYVKAVHLLAPANPFPQIASFFFTPASGRASVASRMRLAQTQEVMAIAEISDGTFFIETSRQGDGRRVRRLARSKIHVCETAHQTAGQCQNRRTDRDQDLDRACHGDGHSQER
jgi:sulfur-oxidizing protein SoxY